MSGLQCQRISKSGGMVRTVGREGDAPTQSAYRDETEAGAPSIRAKRYLWQCQRYFGLLDGLWAAVSWSRRVTAMEEVGVEVGRRLHGALANLWDSIDSSPFGGYDWL